MKEEISKQTQQVIWPECYEPITLEEVLEYIKEHLEENYEEFLQGAVDSTVCGLDCGSLKLIYNHILELQERINKAIEYINEMCLCSDGYANYGDDLSPKYIADILQGKDETN